MLIFEFVISYSTVQHILVKPKVKGVEEDEDLPDDVVYVAYHYLIFYLYSLKTVILVFFQKVDVTVSFKEMSTDC